MSLPDNGTSWETKAVWALSEMLFALQLSIHGMEFTTTAIASARPQWTFFGRLPDSSDGFLFARSLGWIPIRVLYDAVMGSAKETLA